MHCLFPLFTCTFVMRDIKYQSINRIHIHKYTTGCLSLVCASVLHCFRHTVQTHTHTDMCLDNIVALYVPTVKDIIDHPIYTHARLTALFPEIHG